jgi:hypothetical protein
VAAAASPGKAQDSAAAMRSSAGIRRGANLEVDCISESSFQDVGDRAQQEPHQSSDFVHECGLEASEEQEAEK